MDKENVCPLIVPMFAAPLFDMLTTEMLTQLRICDELLGFCATPNVTTHTVEEFNTRVLSTKPEIIQNDDFVNSLYKDILADPNPRSTLTFLHLSDIHLDT